jgi:hypothetical protein
VTPAGALRWDLAIRLVLAVVLPSIGQVLVPDPVSDVFLAAVLSAVLVSLGSLGPEFTRRSLVAVTAVGVPVAVIAGAGAGASRTDLGGELFVLALFTAYGTMVQAGMLAQLAWFPVAAAGMMATLLFGGDVQVTRLLGASVAGSALAVLLIWLVPRLVHTPRLALPPGALAVDSTRLRRMLRRPTWRDWAFPLVLGLLSALLLIVAAAATGGFKPYWAVLAFVTVLAPSKTKTRESALQTIVATTLGVALAAAVHGAGLTIPAQAAVIVVLGAIGAVIMLRNGLLSKVLLTPLPVVTAAWTLDVEGALALRLRLVEYTVGAAVGLVTAVVAAILTTRLQAQRGSVVDDLVG